jgi:hypothetical protein
VSDSPVFVEIPEEEAMARGLKYATYSIVIFFCWLIGFYLISVFEHQDKLQGILCSLPFFLLGLVIILGLQFKIIGDGVAAGLRIYYNENTATDEVSHHNSPDVGKRRPQGGKITQNPKAKPSRGPPKKEHKQNVKILNENIESTEEELRILRDMFKHAKDVGDNETKERLRPKLKDLLRQLKVLRSMENSPEEE